MFSRCIGSAYPASFKPEQKYKPILVCVFGASSWYIVKYFPDFHIMLLNWLT